ncbi:MAG: flavodoxin family protein [Lachnospiraceae bacterium]|nr:flavodoxin family protein [Lachnospiraceae bacterium]MCM1230808.1 flavodoxin family protein [Ruminococcus flavefaciens]
MAEILILNGASRKNGSTAKLIKAFSDGARSAGNEILEFYLQDMNIKGCLGCESCSSAKIEQSTCIQKDDIVQINKSFITADVVVFASPVYFWTITGTLKTATDRLYAQLRSLDYNDFPRKSVLLMTAGGSDYSQAVRWYETFERNLGWKNLGEVLGAGKISEAFNLGVSIK